MNSIFKVVVASVGGTTVGTILGYTIIKKYDPNFKRCSCPKTCKPVIRQDCPKDISN